MTRRRWIADSSTATTATLIGPQADHLARVLRAQPGTEADVVAQGHVYRASIASINPSEVVFTLIEETTADPALPITMLLGIFKFDRMEWAIEKLTELGVQTIVPILARRTEKHLALAAEKRIERWRRLVQEAAQQSRRSDLPVIADPATLQARLTLSSSASRILLAEDERDTSLRQRLDAAFNTSGANAPSLELAIGPEGGWAPEEFALFRQHEWPSATLGPRILRVETAAIAALAIASSMY